MLSLPTLRRAALAAAALCLSACGAGVQITRNPNAGIAAVRKVAVLPFDAAPAQARITGEWEALLLSLGYRVVERDSVEAILKEQGLSLSGLVNPADAPKIGELLGVEGLVIGRPNTREPYYSYSMTGDAKLSEPPPVSVKLIDAATARVVWNVSSETAEKLQVSREGRAVGPNLRRSLAATVADGAKEWGKPGFFKEASESVVAVNRELRVEKGMRVGVYPFRGSNNNGSGDAWADKFAGVLMDAGYDVVDRQQLDKILKEQKISSQGAVRAKEMSLLGKLAGLRAIAMGTVSGGQVCAYSLKLVDVETGELYWGAYGEDCRLGQFSDLLKASFPRE